MVDQIDSFSDLNKYEQMKHKINKVAKFVDLTNKSISIKPSLNVINEMNNTYDSDSDSSININANNNNYNKSKTVIKKINKSKPKKGSKSKQKIHTQSK